MLGSIGRFAGDALRKGLLGTAVKGTQGEQLRALTARLAPDAAFGILAATQTPGDITDKTIAGLTQAAGGALGGAGLSGAFGGGNMATELIGGYGGDMLGMMLGDNLQRAKDKLTGGEGLTAYERLGKEQQQQHAQQVLAQAGLATLPGYQDQYLADLGLG